MKKKDNYHSESLKGLSPGLHPRDSMRTLGHEMLPMNGRESTRSLPTIEDMKPHIKSSYPQAKAPPGKSKLSNGVKSGIVHKYVGNAARIKALGY